MSKRPEQAAKRPDPLSPEQRRLCMSRIKGKNTRPELLVRKSLFALGYRYRLHDNALPGKPDLKLPKWNAVIFVHGCFWHGHDCHFFKWPKKHSEHWRNKLEKNRQNDVRAEAALLAKGWRVVTVWECALRGRTRWPINDVIEALHNWLRSDDVKKEITGKLQ